MFLATSQHTFLSDYFINPALCVIDLVVTTEQTRRPDHHFPSLCRCLKFRTTNKHKMDNIITVSPAANVSIILQKGLDRANVGIIDTLSGTK